VYNSIQEKLTTENTESSTKRQSFRKMPFGSKLLEGGNRASPIPSEFPYLNAEAASPFCHSSWEDKQMKGLTKEIPI